MIRAERRGDLVGYGEHPSVDDALRILADDIRAGGREYGDVYGKMETNYVTGSSAASGPLDAWILRGRTFDAYADGDAFVVTLSGWQELKTPIAVTERAKAGEVVRWTDERGLEFESGPVRFANGDVGTSTKCLTPTRSGADPWMWTAEWSASAGTLADAFAAALLAAV